MTWQYSLRSAQEESPKKEPDKYGPERVVCCEPAYRASNQPERNSNDASVKGVTELR